MAIPFALAVVGAFGGCGSASNSSTAGSSTNTSNAHSSSGGNSSSGSSFGSSSGENSGDDSTSTSSSGGGDDATSPAGDDASPTGDDANPGEGGSVVSDDASSTTPDAATPPPMCVKGQVPPNQVVMIGDSYLDPAYSNAALDLFTDAQNAGSLAANTTYRHYYQGGAAMNYGALQFNIPYQYENEAKTDISVTNPATIDTIIMDGGGNDVLIDNQQCLTTPPPGNMSCVTAIQGTITRAQSLLQEMSTDGVKHIVYFFYPHLDPAGGGLLPTPAPGMNPTLDYAYPLAEQICCGSSFTSTATSFTCSGMIGATQCTFIDTRPAFEGHVTDYIKDGAGQDHVHPSPAGAQVIADLIWQTMTAACIAQ